MATTKLNGATDTHWAVVKSRAETIHNLAAMLSEESGRHMMVRLMCGHIANHSQAMMDFNEQHLRGYSNSADDNIAVMCDRIGTLLRDESLVRALPASHVAIMRAGVAAIRGVLFARQGQHLREQQATRFEQRRMAA